MVSPVRAVIAGGGTGGHLFPALAIAKSLEERYPGIQIHFVGTEAGLEVKKVPAMGYPLHLLSVGKLNLKGQMLAKLKTLLLLPWAFVQSFRLLRQLRPSMVVGVGGYASGPFVLVAALMRYPTALWEPNAHPGLTNRWLAPFVRKKFVVFEEARRFLGDDCEQIGIPVRPEIVAAAGVRSPAESRGQEGAVPPAAFKIFCFGGSQGSRVINNAFFEILKKRQPQDGAVVHGTDTTHWQVVHQIGSTDWKTFQERYRDFGRWVEPLEFIDDMPSKYRFADLVICRAGASTVAELAAFRKPAILIPLPGADAHQEKNAEALAQAGAALCLPQKELTASNLESHIERLQRDPELRRQFSEKIARFFDPQAGPRLAEALCRMGGLT